MVGLVTPHEIKNLETATVPIKSGDMTGKRPEPFKLKRVESCPLIFSQVT